LEEQLLYMSLFNIFDYQSW